MISIAGRHESSQRLLYAALLAIDDEMQPCKLHLLNVRSRIRAGFHVLIMSTLSKTSRWSQPAVA